MNANDVLLNYTMQYFTRLQWSHLPPRSILQFFFCSVKGCSSCKQFQLRSDRLLHEPQALEKKDSLSSFISHGKTSIVVLFDHIMYLKYTHSLSAQNRSQTMSMFLKN